MARSRGGRWLLRIDDLDAPRQIPGMADDMQRTLERFGLTWDGDVAWQSRHRDAYEQAFDSLLRMKAIYPCGCSRKEIAQSASAPHPGDDAPPYSGICRTGMTGKETIRAWRVLVPDTAIVFSDLLRGPISRNPAKWGGDFVVRRGDGEFAYQLAVVVDDHLTGVTQVVRGDDLLPSTCRQIVLQQLLGLPQPEYGHLPLVTGSGGEKLSKRDNPVSNTLRNQTGTEGVLLVAALRFLGQNPPRELADGSCPEILAWGTAHFDPSLIPTRGSGLIL